MAVGQRSIDCTARYAALNKRRVLLRKARARNMSPKLKNVRKFGRRATTTTAAASNGCDDDDRKRSIDILVQNDATLPASDDEINQIVCDEAAEFAIRHRQTRVVDETKIAITIATDTVTVRLLSATNVVIDERRYARRKSDDGIAMANDDDEIDEGVRDVIVKRSRANNNASR